MSSQNLNKLHAKYALNQFEIFSLSELKSMKYRQTRQHACYSHATTDSINARGNVFKLGTAMRVGENAPTANIRAYMRQSADLRIGKKWHRAIPCLNACVYHQWQHFSGHPKVPDLFYHIVHTLRVYGILLF